MKYKIIIAYASVFLMVFMFSFGLSHNIQGGILNSTAEGDFAKIEITSVDNSIFFDEIHLTQSKSECETPYEITPRPILVKMVLYTTQYDPITGYTCVGIEGIETFQFLNGSVTVYLQHTLEPKNFVNGKEFISSLVFAFFSIIPTTFVLVIILDNFY